jgi:hypothetical protein
MKIPMIDPIRQNINLFDKFDDDARILIEAIMILFVKTIALKQDQIKFPV